MKKILSLLIAAALILTAMPALAGDMSSELEDITLKIKEKLNISDDYTSYSGDKIGGNWYLSWTGAQREISVDCADDGTIYSYYVYGGSDFYGADAGFAPSFPDASAEMLMDAAGGFMQRVAGAGEGWLLNKPAAIGLDNGAGKYTINGRITIGGYPTDIEFNITMDMNDMEVTGYYRSDSYMVYAPGSTPDAMNISGEDAKKLLIAKMPLELRYYVEDQDAPARLTYMPAYDGVYIVRASDGEVIDIEYEYAEVSASDEGAAAYGIEPRALTEAEKQGISAYADALSVEDLDALLRGMSELGITQDYMLTDASYHSGDGELTAALAYSRSLTDSEVMARYGYDAETMDDMRVQGNAWYDRKYATVNAYDGAIARFNTYRSYGEYEKTAEGDAGEYGTAAQDFIDKYMPDISGELTLDKAENAEYRFVRMHDGYKLYADYVRVSVNVQDGSIDSVERQWDAGREFENPEEIIEYAEAQEAFLSAMDYEAAYVSVPVKETAGETVYDLTLCWHFDNAVGVYGVDAVSGGALLPDDGDGLGQNYDDVAGLPQEKMILKLAEHSVGFRGGSFMPDAPFTVSDMLTLMLCMDGITDAEDWEFSKKAGFVERLGAGDFSSADPDAQVTRAAFVKALISGAGYGKAAKIQGIFNCCFADAADIPAEDVGAAVIAEALGVIAPDSEGMIRAGEALTRAQAAEIAYNFLCADK